VGGGSCAPYEEVKVFVLLPKHSFSVIQLQKQQQNSATPQHATTDSTEVHVLVVIHPPPALSIYGLGTTTTGNIITTNIAMSETLQMSL
jgi:hypothetical protein